MRSIQKKSKAWALSLKCLIHSSEAEPTNTFIGSCTATYNLKLTSLKTSYAVNKIVNIMYPLGWSKYVPVESALKLGSPGSQVIYVKSNMYQEAIFCNHMSVIGYFKDSWQN